MFCHLQVVGQAGGAPRPAAFCLTIKVVGSRQVGRRVVPGAPCSQQPALVVMRHTIHFHPLRRWRRQEGAALSVACRVEKVEPAERGSARGGNRMSTPHTSAAAVCKCHHCCMAEAAEAAFDVTQASPLPTHLLSMQYPTTWCRIHRSLPSWLAHMHTCKRARCK